MKIKYKTKYINYLKNVLSGQHSALPNIYRKIFEGNRIDHVTIEEIKNGKISYMSVPYSAYKLALRKQEENKFKPIQQMQDVKLYNKNFNQYLFNGRFTQEEIRKKAQEMSDDLAKQGKTGKISVAIRYYGTERGLWRSGRMTDYGAPIKTAFDNYDLEEITNSAGITGFAIYTN